MKEMYIYILRCSDKSLYVGVTNDYLTRFEEHQKGIDPSCYTFKRRPLELVYAEEYDDPLDAIAREKQLKGWGRAKKEVLIQGDMQSLRKLSLNRTGIVTVRKVVEGHFDKLSALLEKGIPSW